MVEISVFVDEDSGLVSGLELMCKMFINIVTTSQGYVNV
jgi:hypothetical protein